MEDFESQRDGGLRVPRTLGWSAGLKRFSFQASKMLAGTLVITWGGGKERGVGGRGSDGNKGVKWERKVYVYTLA